MRPFTQASLSRRPYRQASLHAFLISHEIQNIKNQVDHPSSSYIQWQESYKKELRRMKFFETQAELSKETIAKLLNML